MAVESVQCPKCGASLSVEPDREHTFCSYCGAGLKLALGVSGHPMAVLDDIKTDTSILAKEVALRRLTDKITEKQRAVRALLSERATELEALPSIAWEFRVLCAFFGIPVTIAAICAFSFEAVAAGLLVLAMGLPFLYLAVSPVAGLKKREGLQRIAQLDARIHSISQEIEDLQEQISAKEADMDALTDQV